MKNRFIAFLSAFLILMAGSGIGAAAEIIVHSGESIQAAVDNASEGDTILVEPGTYYETVTVNTQNLIIKSKSGNPDNTIITGDFYLGDDVNLNPVYDGFTFTSNTNTWTVCTSGETSCTVQNCKIIHGGLLVDQDSGMYILNTQFIECEYPIMTATFTDIYVENCKFIDCTYNIPSEGYESSVVSKNNVEIHTDASGKQIVTPIPDYPEEPVDPEPPAGNNTTEPTPTPTEPAKPTPTDPVPTPTEPAKPTPTDPVPKTPTETPVEETGGSSGGNSHHSSSSSGSSGGTGGSPEPQKNVASKDTAKVFVPNEKQVTFNFINNVTVVDSISFTSKKTMGKITAITEDLKNKSSLVKDLPERKIYKSFNIWVGNAGYGDSNNINNATVDFKVEKSWLQENDINKSSIVLYKYDSENKEWIEIIPTITCEDDKFVYFTAKVPGYSSFAIGNSNNSLLAEKAANTRLTEDSVCEKPIGEIKCNGNNNGEIRSTGNGTVTKGTPKSSGFGLISGIACLFGMFLYRVKGR